MSNMYTTENVIKIFNELGYTYISENTKNQYDKITIKDNDGYLYYNHIANISRRAHSKMKIFGINNPYTIDNIKTFLKLNKSDTKLLDNEFINSNYKMTWVCGRCNSKFNRSWSTFQSMKSCLCPNCSLKSKSYISWLTKNWLSENNIIYTMEKKYDTCINKRQLPFDYYLNDYNILIEVDGKQHYDKNSNFGNDKYEETVLHDKIKTNWAKENNIKLIRLPYWEFKNDNYKKILEKEILNL